MKEDAWQPPPRSAPSSRACPLPNGRGEVPVTVRRADPAAAAPPVVSQDVVVTFPRPLDVVTFSLELSALTFARPGLYRWQVVCGGEVPVEVEVSVGRTWGGGVPGPITPGAFRTTTSGAM